MDAAWVSAAAADVVAVRASQAAVHLVQRVRAALKATLDGFLSSMVLDEMLTGYTLDVSATRAQEIAGQAVVTMTLRPTFSIEFVKVIMNLQ